MVLRNDNQVEQHIKKIFKPFANVVCCIIDGRVFNENEIFQKEEREKIPENCGRRL